MVEKVNELYRKNKGRVKLLTHRTEWEQQNNLVSKSHVRCPGWPPVFPEMPALEGLSSPILTNRDHLYLRELNQVSTALTRV